MQNPFSDGVSVKVGGDSSGATRALGNVQNSLLSTKKIALGLGGVLAGALAAKGLGAAVSAASDFEDAMIEVEKVTDPETAGEMASRVRDMAQEMPLAQEELAGLAAQAGRFGIEGSDNIEKFVETTAKMATATDLSSDQAGEAFARLATLTNEPIENVGDMGNVINELSNTMATSSQEIVDASLRSSGVLSQLGLESEEIFGLSAAMNEASESSERAGTRLRRFAQEIQDPKKTSDMAEALGMTEEAFRDMRDSDPQELIQRLVEAFAEGGETAENLRGVLSTTSQQALAGLSQNIEGLGEAYQTANDEVEDGTSLQEEFDAATSTFSSRVTVLKNNLREMAITVGNELLPLLTPLVDRFTDFVQGIDIQRLISDFRGFASVISGAFTDLFGDVTIGELVAKFKSFANNVSGFINEVVGDADGLVISLSDMRDIGIAVLERLQVFWANWGDEITAVLSGLVDFASEKFTKLWGVLQDLWETHGKELFGEGGEITETLEALQDFWNEWGDEITAVVNFLFGVSLGVAKTALDAMLTLVRVVLNVIQGDWEEAWGAIAGFFERTFNKLLGFISEWGGVVIDAIISAIPESIRGRVRDAIGAVSDITAPQVQSRFSDVGGQSSQSGERVVVENQEVIRFKGDGELTRLFAAQANEELSRRERRARGITGP